MPYVRFGTGGLGRRLEVLARKVGGVASKVGDGHARIPFLSTPFLSLPILSLFPYSLPPCSPSPYSLSRSLSQRKVGDGEARIDLLCQNMHTLRVAQVRLS